MSEVPGTEWAEDFCSEAAPDFAPFHADWQQRPVEVKHTFTHFHLRLTVYRADLTADTTPLLDGAWWSAPEVIETEALPTVMKKALAAAFESPRK